MEIKILKYPGDEDWMLCKTCALATVHKNAVTAPGIDWKKHILEARHSPIRELRFVFRIDGIPYYTAMHLVRHHVGCQPYISSQRNDRQSDYDRTKAPQDAPVNMIWSMNADALITIAQKRLCMQADVVTREVVSEICRLVIEKCPEFSGVLKPACEWHGGVCHEMFPCGRAKS